MKTQIAVLFTCYGFLAVHGMSSGSQVNMTLDPEEKFNVSWSFDGKDQSSYIIFSITCRTTGWVGIGLSPNGDMTNADIMIGWVGSDGTGYLLDMYATSNGVPVKDMSQDVTLIHAEEIDGVTMIKFKRKLDTCDYVEDKMITSSTTRLIYAYKDSDPVNGIIGSSDYHGSTNRGVKSLYLLESKGVGKPEYFPTDTLTFDVKVDNYNIPAEDTTYYCSFHEPPQLDTKHHIVAIEPIITKENIAIVHHILLYGCWGIENEHLRNNNKTEGLCYTSEMPEFTDSCAMTLHGWAVGGGIFYYPEEAGYSIGGTNGTSPQYFMMEMHYDNPQKLDTIVDSSGLRLVYSSSLRNQDSGILPVGMVAGIAVPPLANNFRTTSHCDSECTNQWIPAEGINVFGYLLHTHLIGRSVQVEWYRGGEHIGLLAYDDNYDFNFQETRQFDEEKKVLPGDTLKVTCNYTNPYADHITYGGLATSEEMCIVYLSYYPKQDMVTCASFPKMLWLADDPVYEALSLDAAYPGTMYANIQVLDQVSDWTDSAVAILQGGYDNSQHYAVCDRHGGSYDRNLYPFNATMYKSKARPAVQPCTKSDDVGPSSQMPTNQPSTTLEDAGPPSQMPTNEPSTTLKDVELSSQMPTNEPSTTLKDVELSSQMRPLHSTCVLVFASVIAFLM